MGQFASPTCVIPILIFKGAGAEGTASTAQTGRQGQKLRHDAVRYREVCPSRGPRHHVGSAYAPAKNRGQKSALPTCKTRSQGMVHHESGNPLLTSGGQEQPHQLFQP